MFGKLVGNDRVKEILLRLLETRRVPNALLFAGPEGVGKKKFALEVAKAFVCREPKGAEACDECPACKRADVFVFPKKAEPDTKEEFKRVIFSEHPDLGMVIPYNRNILVAASRDLEREAQFRPYEAQARFFLIEDAHKMNEEASNALLKTLEEPAPTSHIFLITSRPDSLLQTIRSRCQVIRFSPVEAEGVVRVLEYSGKFSPDEAELAAAAASGSIGKAMAVKPKDFRMRRSAMMEVVHAAIVDGDHVSLLRKSEEMNEAKNKDAFEEYLDVLQTLIHDVWVARLGDEGAVANKDLLEEIRQLSAKASAPRLAKWLEEIENVRLSLAININRKIATDALFVKMAN